MVFILINPDTREIVSYSLNGPDDQQLVREIEQNQAKFPSFLKEYMITDPRIYNKVREAREFLGEMKPVFNETGDLIDIQVTYPDLGKDR